MTVCISWRMGSPLWHHFRIVTMNRRIALSAFERVSLIVLGGIRWRGIMFHCERLLPTHISYTLFGQNSIYQLPKNLIEWPGIRKARIPH